MKPYNMLLFILVLSLIGGLALASCFRKKSPPKNIEAWLDLHMPGQLQVLDSNLKMLDVMAQFKGEKQALLADRNNPDIQFLVDWQKGAENLELDQAFIQARLATARQDYQQSSALYQQFLTAGLEHVSTGIYKQEIFIQYYAEPVPAEREKIRKVVLQVMKEWPKAADYTLYLQIMEPMAYKVKMQNIIPFGHYVTENGWQKEQEIMSLNFPVNDMDKESWQWDVNPVSTRAVKVTDEAFERAKTWTQKHLPKAQLTEGQAIGFEVMKHPDPSYQIPDPASPSVRISFPYTLGHKPAEDYEFDGYITCVYVFDRQEITQIKVEKDR